MMSIMSKSSIEQERRMLEALSDEELIQQYLKLGQEFSEMKLKLAEIGRAHV